MYEYLLGNKFYAHRFLYTFSPQIVNKLELDASAINLYFNLTCTWRQCLIVIQFCRQNTSFITVTQACDSLVSLLSIHVFYSALLPASITLLCHLTLSMLPHYLFLCLVRQYVAYSYLSISALLDYIYP